MRRPLAIALFVAMLSELLAVTRPATARPVRVRSKTAIQAQSRMVAGVLQLKGRLTNDDGVPIPTAWLTLSPRPQLPSARTCSGRRTLFAQSKLRADQQGEFCLRWGSPPPQGQLELVFPGDRHHASSRLTVRYDRSQEQRLETRLRFSPRPHTIDLDEKQVTLSASLGFERSSTFANRHGLTVRLEQASQGTVIAKEVTAGDGKLRFSIDPKRLGEPGPTRLRLVFDGTPELAPAQDEHTINQTAIVRLKPTGPLPSLTLGKKVEIPLQVHAAGHLVRGGVVEATSHSGASLGSATVSAGLAQVVIAARPEHEHRLSLTLRYVPGPPWFATAEPLPLVLTAAPSNTPEHLMLGLLLLTSGIWVGLTWRRSRRRPKTKKEAPALQPGLHLVGKRNTANRWTGRVVDAHEGSPIAHAKLTICRPSLEDDGVLLSVSCDNQGHFSFELIKPLPEHVAIQASSPLHTTERCPLPAAGQICIALSTRRRASLARFIAWARRHGPTSHQGPDPTPAEVIDATDRHIGAKEWAQSVEETVFGPTPVDAQMEQHLKNTEPKPHATSPLPPTCVDDAT